MNFIARMEWDTRRRGRQRERVRETGVERKRYRPDRILFGKIAVRVRSRSSRTHAKLARGGKMTTVLYTGCSWRADSLTFRFVRPTGGNPWSTRAYCPPLEIHTKSYRTCVLDNPSNESNNTRRTIRPRWIRCWNCEFRRRRTSFFFTRVTLVFSPADPSNQLVLCVTFYKKNYPRLRHDLFDYPAALRIRPAFTAPRAPDTRSTGTDFTCGMQSRTSARRIRVRKIIERKRIKPSPHANRLLTAKSY